MTPAAHNTFQAVLPQLSGILPPEAPAPKRQPFADTPSRLITEYLGLEGLVTYRLVCRTWKNVADVLSSLQERNNDPLPSGIRPQGLCHHTLAHTNHLRSYAFSLDGTKIISQSNGCIFLTNPSDRKVQVWSASTGELLYTLAHESDMEYGAFSPDGTKILSQPFMNINIIDDIINGGNITIWNASTGKLLHTLPHTTSVESREFSPDGTKILLQFFSGRITIWSASTGELLYTLAPPSGARSGAFSPDGTKIISRSFEREVQIWSASTGEPLHTLSHSGQVDFCAFSPDGTKILSESDGKRTITIWSASTGEPLHTFNANQNSWELNSFRSCAFSPDGTKIIFVLSIAHNREVQIWSVSTWQLLHTLRCVNTVYSCEFSPNGETIISLSNGDDFPFDRGGDRAVQIWSASTGKNIFSSLDPKDRVDFCAFSPDGKTIISRSARDHTVKIRSASTGKLLHTLKGHTERVRSCAFSPDGKRIISTSKDNTAKIWIYEKSWWLNLLWNKIDSHPSDDPLNLFARLIESKMRRDLFLTSKDNGTRKDYCDQLQFQIESLPEAPQAAAQKTLDSILGEISAPRTL